MDVLISGASIAGLTTAALLAGRGHRVTVVERAGAQRSGGVAIDVRGEAVDVARELGVLDEIRAARVPHDDVFRFVDAEGRTRATMRPADDVYEATDDIEISRDLLAGILERRLPGSVAVDYDRWVAAITDVPEGAEVTLSDGSRRVVDLVVGADGLHSGVRAAAFGPEGEFVHHLGLYVAILTSCRSATVDTGSVVFNTPGRLVMLRSDGARTSALLGFRSPWIDHDFRDVESQRRRVVDAFAGHDGWVTREVVGELAASDAFYFDAVSQVRMESWSRGRAVLVGDAAYSPSFFSGMGTTLAMVGARHLALALDGVAPGEPAQVERALARYDRSMRPIVTEAHAIAEVGAGILFPRTSSEIAERDARFTPAASAGGGAGH